MVTVMILLSGASLALMGLIRVNGIMTERLLLGKMMEQLFSLKSLTLEYVNNPSERGVLQWEKKYGQIDIHAVHGSVTADVLESYANIPVIFQEIVSLHEKQPVDELSRLHGQRYREQLFSLILIETQRIIDWSQRLSDGAQARLVSVIRFYSIGGLALLVLISVITGLILYNSKKRFVTSISTLKRGAEAIAAGDLTHRINLVTEDEFGELANSFNVMADKLKTQVELENRLAQTQKIEALGTMAGGIAHDFNNILSAIIGYTELIEMKNRDVGLNEYLENVLKAANRASDLVKQILTFSRVGKPELSHIQLKPIVKEVLKFMRATIPSTIDIQSTILTDAKVYADPTDLHRVIVNLCTNAAIAMSEQGGTLFVRLEDRQLDTLFADNHEIQAGHFVRLSVRDSGCGMTPAVQARIFEPFFTTHQDRGGTGMGLSVVYGIVKSLLGAITVESEPGKGTTIDIYLPMTVTEEIRSEAKVKEFLHGNERILFVDDEPAIAESLGNGLESLGYEVTTFTNSVEALQVFQQDPAAFDVVISDMTMPLLTGDALADSLHHLRPDLPFVLCTGFTDRITAEEAKERGIDQFVMKPVSANQLSQIIRQVIKKSA